MNGGEIVQAASPVEVYRNPAARFVGSFIGNPPMNFLPATSIGGNRWQIGDSEFNGPDVSKTRDGQAEFAVRPEDVTVGEGPLEATVRVVEPLGSHILANCRLGDHMFRVIMPSDSQVATNQALKLNPQPDRIRWFDAQSGAALPL